MVSCARWMLSSSKQMTRIKRKEKEKMKKNKGKIKLSTISLDCSLCFTWEIQIERLHTGQHWCRGIVTPHQTTTRLNPPSPPNPSENAGYLLLLSPSLHFPALTAGYCSTVCTLQSCWVKEKTVQVIRQQTNKNSFFLLSLPSSLNKATSQTESHCGHHMTISKGLYLLFLLLCTQTR